MKKICIAVLAGMLSTTVPSQAVVVYDNGGPSELWGGTALNGDLVTADDFSIAGGASITGVGFYFQNYSGIAGWDNQISYIFYADNAGKPGAILSSGAGIVTSAVDSGLPWCCTDGNAFEIQFALQSPFAADAGVTYWLGLTGAGGPYPWWVVTSAGNAHQSGFPLAFDYAFYLRGTERVNETPIPAALALFPAGLGVLGLLARRRKQQARAA